MFLLPILLAVFYPLLQEHWDTPDPPPEIFLSGVQAPTFIPDTEIAVQMEYMRNLADPLERSRIVLELDKANNPRLCDVLEKRLLVEDDENVRADILRVILEIVRREKIEIAKAPYMERAFTSSIPLARACAYELFIIAKGAPEILIKSIASEKEDFVIRRVFDAIRNQETHRYDYRFFMPIASDEKSKAYIYALEYVAANDPAADSNSALRKAVSSNDPKVMTYLAKGLAQNSRGADELLGKLAVSEHLPVRLAVASARANTPATLKMIEKLSRDKSSSSVRRAACVALGRRQGTIDTLFERFADDEKLVSLAAAESMAKQCPEILPDKILATPNTHALAIVVKAALNPRYAQLIAKRLITESDADTIISCLETLAALAAPETLDAILTFADSKNPDIRRSVAFALEKFKDTKAYSALDKLALDKDPKTALAALTVMGRVADKAFLETLNKAIVNMDRASSYRATAAWAVSRQPSINSNTLNALNKIILTRCIVLPRTPPAYDNSGARGIAFMSLRRLAERKMPDAERYYQNAVSRFKNPSQEEKGNSFCDDYMSELVRQVVSYNPAKLPNRKEVSGFVPDMTYEKVKKGK